MSKIVKKLQKIANKKTKIESEEDVLLREQMVDILAEANNMSFVVDTTSLPHYALAKKTVATPSLVTKIPTWVYLAGGVALSSIINTLLNSNSSFTTYGSTVTAENRDDIRVAKPSEDATKYQATTTVSSANDIRIDGLTSDIKYQNDTSGKVELTYSFPWTTSEIAIWSDNYGSGENSAKTHYGLNSTQRGAIRLILQSWSDVSNVVFKEVDENTGDVGEVRFGFSSIVTNANSWGWSYMPSNGAEAGDTWIATDLDKYNGDFSKTGYGYHSLIHELGHTLGLKHPGNYGSDDKAPFYDAEHDNKMYSVMSYNDPKNNIWVDAETSQEIALTSQSPMMYDLLAIQYLYGKNNNYKTGDDTYSFDDIPPFRITMWDAGGMDTISVANSTRGSLIDLNEGSFSSIQTSRVYSKESISATVDGTYNLGIAYGAIIENAVGGSGDDTLIGNQASNTLTGNSGKDFFEFKSTLNTTNDTITDFNHTDDTIKLDDAIFTKLTTGELSSEMFKTGVASDANDYILYDSSNGNLSYDSDGDGTALAILFANLYNKPNDLSYDDFVII